MSRKKIWVLVVIGSLTVFAGTALAFSELFFTSATVSSYDFGGYGPGYPVPGTVVIEGFTMSPGDSVGWHYHKGLSYIIVARGKIAEQEIVGPGHCVSRQDKAGQAFVEPPGRIHNVTNNGTDTAVIWWATVFPASDGLQSDGTYPVDPPNCN
jgi:quercetin dioxygenase-like cupin family protein